MKFDHEIKGNPLEFQASFPISLRPKLTWRLGYVLFTVNLLL